MKKKTTKVISSPEEAQREEVAKKLASQGVEAFGDPDQTFDLGADMTAMKDVNMVSGEVNSTEQQNKEVQALEAAGFGASSPAPQANSVPNVEPKPNTSALPPQENKGEEPLKLSDDPKEKMAQVSKILKEIRSDAPSGETLMQWKDMCGDIYVITLDEKIFVYRYLKRQEWVQIQANPAWAEMRDDQQEDSIFSKCVLWPEMDTVQKASLPAGAMSMVVQQIRMQSMFLDPMYVAQMTIKL